MGEPPVDAIKALVEYLVHDEREHFEGMRESGQSTANHIFNHVEAVADWLTAVGVGWRDPHEEALKEFDGDMADLWSRRGEYEDTPRYDGRGRALKYRH
jgi:hypothetical protein